MRQSKKIKLPHLQRSLVFVIIGLLVLTLARLASPLLHSHHAPELPSESKPVRLYSNQADDDLTELYVNAIKSAKSSLDIVIYSIKNPQIIEAIKESCDAGIKVNLVCDAQASKGITKQFLGSCIHLVRRAGAGLTHQKILVIDKETVLLGSSNFTTDSLQVHGNLVVGFESSILATALKNKIESMDEDSGSELLLHQETIIDGEQIELWVLPDDNKAIHKIKSLIRGAQKTIQLALFTWTRKDLADEVIRAHERGVKVEAVIDRYSGNGAGTKIVEMLENAGIPVRLSSGRGLMHHKFAIIDNEILINGSANWTVNAFTVNDDCFLIMRPLTEEQKTKLGKVWDVLTRDSK